MTNEHARHISESMRKRGRGQVQHYHCQHCGAWHVGNGTPRMPDRRRQGYGKNQFDGGA